MGVEDVKPGTVLYIDSDDFNRGGWAVVEAVEMMTSAGKPTPFVRFVGIRGSMYNLPYLLAEQDELRGLYWMQRAGEP